MLKKCKKNKLNVKKENKKVKIKTDLTQNIGSLAYCN